jgi:L-rhamnose mutarotase
MTIGERHDAIANQYYKELDKANAVIYHYSIVIDKPNKQIIKAYLKKRNCNSLTDFLYAEELF